MRTKALLLSSFALALTTCPALADTYQAELNLGVGKTTVDYGPLFEKEKIDHGFIGGTYYFDGVTTRNHPLADAAFLEKSSNISVTFTRDRARFEDDLFEVNNGGINYIGSGRFTTTSSFTSADLEFYIPNSLFYIGGGIGEGRERTRYRVTDGITTEEGSYSDSTGSFWGVRLGLTPINGLLVWSEFYKDQEISDEWNINAKYVFDWSGNAVNLEASYDRFFNEDTLSLAADFYFDRTFSVGAIYDYHQGDLEDAYGLRTRKFFTDRLALEASYATSDSSDSYNLGISYRF